MRAYAPTAFIELAVGETLAYEVTLIMAVIAARMAAQVYRTEQPALLFASMIGRPIGSTVAI